MGNIIIAITFEFHVKLKANKRETRWRDRLFLFLFVSSISREIISRPEGIFASCHFLISCGDTSWWMKFEVCARQRWGCFCVMHRMIIGGIIEDKRGRIIGKSNLQPLNFSDSKFLLRVNEKRNDFRWDIYFQIALRVFCNFIHRNYRSTRDSAIRARDF